MVVDGPIVYLVSSDATEPAVTWQVAELAKAWRRPVVLVGVRRTHWLAFVAREQQQALKLALVDVAGRLRALKCPVAGIKVASGEASTESRRIATRLGAGLIMVSAGAAALRDPAAISLTALEIARRARQDVWICKPSADPHLDHVLCAADTSPLAAEAVRRALDLGRRFNARLRIVSVLDEPAPPLPNAAATDDADGHVRSARARQKEFLEAFDLRGVPLSRAVIWGAQAPVELLLEAERYPDGLLVIGASSASPHLGATTEPVLRACPSSVLIVRRRGALSSVSEEAPEAQAVGTAVAFEQDADGA